MSWYDQYFTPQWEKRFRYQAGKLFKNHPEMIEDAHQTAWMKLFQNLKKSKKGDISDAYVMASFKNLLVDEYRHHFGRCRPHSWVKKLGAVWERIAVILCQEKLPAQEIARQMGSTNACCTTEPVAEQQVDFIVRQLKSKPYCSTLGSNEEPLPEDKEVVAQDALIEDDLSHHELTFLLQLILGGEDDNPVQSKLSNHIIKQWQPLTEQLANVLTDDDHLVLKLVFAENYSVAKAARILNKSTAKIRYQLNQLLQNLKRILQQNDIDLTVLET